MSGFAHRLGLAACLPAALFAAGELSNRPAPSFRLADTKGRVVSLPDYKGKFLVIEFMSTTCPHCQNFAGALESLLWRFKGRIGVLSIATYPDTAATVAKFIETYKVSYPILLDPTHATALAYLKPRPPNYSYSIPHVFLIDAAGHIRDDFTQTPSNQETFSEAGLSRLVGGYVNPESPRRQGAKQD